MNRFNISFAGSGWGMTYHLGFISSLRKQKGKIPNYQSIKYSGASGGSLAATIQCFHLDPEEIMQFLLEKSVDFEGRISPSLMKMFIQSQLDYFVPSNSDMDYFIQNELDQRLNVSVTLVDGMMLKNRIVNEFKDAGELKEALYASCYIPYYTGEKFFTEFRGVKALDGGLTNNAPLLEERTFVVSPVKVPTLLFPYAYDICYTSTIGDTVKILPRLLVPNGDILKDMYKRGEADGELFLSSLSDDTLPFNRKKNKYWK
eukprot:TRINITY_DN6961_c0_g1_i1.p1 TRINITY_DN6961_c0_g1~~TRINITY_DN6961_c0_g1_i1.p1  ORF type:complete len:259 (-),score=56.21 TRINITY_DN6961_c0_g1_i1:4-780(-)